MGDEYDELWPSDRPGAVVDWIEFVTEPVEDDSKPRRFVVNLSFMLSRWMCVFGQGCPSTLIRGASNDGGCCQIGVHVGEGEDFERVESAVQLLCAEDADNYADIIRPRGWFRLTGSDEPDEAYHTRIKHDMCIFNNRVDGPTGKPGCALHHLATRLDQHHSETKPDICWQIPFSVQNEDDGEMVTTTVSASAGSVWGSRSRHDLKNPGYWCIETPDAYLGDKYVFRYGEAELRLLMTDLGYTTMVDIIKNVLANGGRRSRMPGEEANGGRPMITQLIGERVKMWQSRDMLTQLTTTARHGLMPRTEKRK